MALTVAGQWRSFTAFPSILTIAVMNFAARSESSLYAMERFSMTSTFIARLGREVKASDSAALEFKVPPCFIVRLKDLWEIMVTPGRLELPTRSLGNCCSIHLSYGATFRINHIQTMMIFLGHFRSPKDKMASSGRYRKDEHNSMKTTRTRYQNGSIAKIPRASGLVWKVRFSELKDGKRWQKCLIFIACL